jgi:hypothetical protein
MDNAGVFDPAWNAVRAESKKRVLLAKKLSYKEICKAAAICAVRSAIRTAVDFHEVTQELAHASG